MPPKETPFSDDEVRILLNFVNANKELILSPSNKYAVVTSKNEKWAEIAATLSAKGTFRKLNSVAQKWKNLKDFAKSEWHKANGKIKPTGGGRAYQLDWKASFIIETIGVEFHVAVVIPGGFDSSNLSASAASEDPAINAFENENNDYSPNDPSLLLSIETGNDSFNDCTPLSTPNRSPIPSSSKRKRSAADSFNDFTPRSTPSPSTIPSSSKKRSAPEEAESGKEEKYRQILDLELKNQRLLQYKLLLEIGLLKEKRRVLGLPEEPEMFEPEIPDNL